MPDKLVVIEILEEIELPKEEKEKVFQRRITFRQTWQQIDRYDIAYGARKRKLPHAE